MKRALFAVLLSVLATGAFAQSQANFTYKLDVDTGTYYCRLNGINNDPYGTAFPGRGTIETSGSSTTVTGVNASDDVFRYVSVGDVISVQVGGTVELRVVDVKTDDDTVTVDTAIDLSAGYVWTYYQSECGTGDDDGWVDVVRTSESEGNSWMIVMQFDQGDMTQVDMQIQCRAAGKGAEPVIVYPGSGDTCGQATLSGSVCQFTTPGISQRLAVSNVFSMWSACRVRIDAGADTNDTGTNRENVTVQVVAQ